ncbi:glycosyltransferase family 9 protein [Magnetospira sp. QH-2]|uniref:glycosyltransferase family 9 protein n=1 Tax=Magnetospira sp. (strain QH-2) TaxID=1288970 RepID=UPI0003E80C4B|nr:glycosyltransferase family 9 protein [Magnetospira sp. QH-2]CCQ72073.1 GT9 : distantly related to LPS heptosyltransferase II [Magnetospira sp. QH-2]
MKDIERILVIKLGALGDFVQALGPMKAIRDHHPDACITLLTTKPYADLGVASGLVDRVWIDSKPKISQPSKIFDLWRTLHGGRFDQVYDLQTSDRSSFYFRLMGRRAAWSGIATGCSQPHDNPRRNDMHTIERQAEQLHKAGIENVPFPDLSWAATDLDPTAFGLKGDYALLVPGGAAHRPAKRWSIKNYGILARALAERGLTPAILGTEIERETAWKITGACPQAVSLIGKTDFLQIAGLARRAKLAVGNDSGPMHLITIAGTPSLVLYSHASDPALCAQRGPKVEILRRPSLADLTLEEVLEALP